MSVQDEVKRFCCIGSVLLAVAGGCSKEQPPQPPDMAPPISTTPSLPYKAPPMVSSTPFDTEGAGRGTMDPPGLARIYFDYDSSTLSADARATLQEDYQTLRSTPSLRVEIEGHTDERGTNEYNMALGQKRANAVKNYLVQLGITSSRIETISYGEELPAVVGHDESAFSKNRRAQFRVLGQ